MTRLGRREGLLGLATAFGIAYATLSLLRFRRLDTPSWDNAIFQQAIASYSRLHAPIVDIKGPGFNLLGDHFSPIIALLAPVYRLAPYAQTLLIAQAVLVAASVIPIGWYAMERLGVAAGTGIAIAYGLSFGIQSAIYSDFHEIAFGAPILAFAGVAYLRRNWHAVVVWSLLLLLVKEDLGITVAAIGVVLMLVGRRRTGLLLACMGVIAFVLIVAVVIPAFNPSGTYDYLGAVGGDGGPSALSSLLSDWGTKTLTLVTTFGITGFLALRSPWALVTVPTFLWRFAGDNPYYWGTDWHYSLVLMPIVFVAMLDGIERSQARGPAWLTVYARQLPLAAAAIAIALCVKYPLGTLVEKSSYETSPRAADAHAVMAKIPKDASVETDIGLITHLVDPRTVYWTGTIGSKVPDYVLVDNQSGGWSGAVDARGYAERQHRGTRYRTIFDRGGYQLAARVP